MMLTNNFHPEYLAGELRCVHLYIDDLLPTPLDTTWQNDMVNSCFRSIYFRLPCSRSTDDDVDAVSPV